MRKSIFIVLLFILSCKQVTSKTTSKNKEDSKRIIKVYSQNDLYRLRMENHDNDNIDFEIIDTVCINQSIRAKEDIRKGKLIYTMYGAYTKKQFCCTYDIKEILAKYNIEAIRKDGIKPDFETKEFKKNYCYQIEMRKAIDSIYGTKFIDSLELVAERKYVKRYPSKVYDISQVDTVSWYPKGKGRLAGFYNFYDDYKAYCKIPKDFDWSKEQGNSVSYSGASFILYSNSKISNLKVETSFVNAANEKYEKLFNQRMTKFVKTTKWKPLTRAGLPVNCKMYIFFNYLNN